MSAETVSHETLAMRAERMMAERAWRRDIRRIRRWNRQWQRWADEAEAAEIDD